MERDTLARGLADAGCSEGAAALICALHEAGDYPEMLRQMRRQRWELVEAMHESQKRVDRMDYLIFSQEKTMNKEANP